MRQLGDERGRDRGLGLARAGLAVFVLLVAPHHARAQDVPGIELCTAEKTMERRTGCLQSNVNFLKAALTKATLDSQRKLDAAGREIVALKTTAALLQKTVEQLQGRIEALEKKQAETSKPPAKEISREPAAK